MNLQCRICGHVDGNRPFVAREMMFGDRTEHAYVECTGCGSLQIAELPGDMAHHYRKGYYSFQQTAISPLHAWLYRLRAAHLTGGFNPAGALLCQLIGPPYFGEWIRRGSIQLETSILDVGCGSGQHLHALAAAGFTRLSGLDPFLDGDHTFPNGVRVRRAALESETTRYGFIMCHHALEHMPDPAAALGQMRRLLEPGGCILIRTPVADSHAWRKYRENWVQLDAPRHFHILTRTGMTCLARAAGLVVSHVDWDSNGFQFWGSEQYVHDIPHNDPRSWGHHPEQSIFSPAQSRSFEREARALNRRGEGDQACFYLRDAGGCSRGA